MMDIKASPVPEGRECRFRLAEENFWLKSRNQNFYPLNWKEKTDGDKNNIVIFLTFLFFYPTPPIWSHSLNAFKLSEKKERLTLALSIPVRVDKPLFLVESRIFQHCQKRYELYIDFLVYWLIYWVSDDRSRVCYILIFNSILVVDV